PEIVNTVTVPPVNPNVAEEPARCSRRYEPPIARASATRLHENRVPAPFCASSTAASNRTDTCVGDVTVTVHVGSGFAPAHAAPHTPNPDAESGTAESVTCLP